MAPCGSFSIVALLKKPRVSGVDGALIEKNCETFEQAVEAVVIDGVVLRLYLGLGAVDVVVVDLHVEAAGALRQRLADLAEAVDAELLAVETLADELQRLPAGPRARADHVLAFAGAACRAQAAAAWRFRPWRR